MLGRFAANAARTWTISCCRRVCICNVSNPAFSRLYSSLPKSEDEALPLANIVERKLKSVRSSLSISYPLKPSSVDEFEVWKDVVKVADIEVALRKCGDRLLSAPNWVLLYLFSTKVYTPSHAVAAVEVILQRFAQLDKVLQPALVILAIRFLARQQVEAPVPSLISLFLVLDLPAPSTQFNLLLRNMSHFKHSPILAKVTTQILDAMHGRQIKLHSRTYRTLLSNSLVSLELAKKLQQSMELQGTQPNRHHLEAYLRVFAHHGAVHASARYLNLIRKQSEETGGDIIPHGVELSSHGARAIKSGKSVNSRYNTQFLTTFKRHTGSAFQYLRDLVNEKDFAPIVPQTARKESRVGIGTRKDRPRVSKQKTHVSDWATVLNVAARDTKVSSTRLLQLFDEIKAKTGYPLTVATFTILMRGLARKGDHATALDVWERCCVSWTRRRKIDTKALTVAMEVIVANGYHLAAFDTLVETTGVLFDWENKPKKLDRTAIGRRYKRALYSKYAKVDVPLVNALMNAYQKNGRQDLVFKLWDVFFPLFGVHPNGDTLTIVLDAAYAVSRWDHTFRGLLEQLGLHDLFRSASRSSTPLEEKSRHQIAQHLRSSIRRGSPFTSPITSHSSSSHQIRLDPKEVAHEARHVLRKTLWNGELAAPKAIKLFQEIVLGNYPALRYITPPARAVWPDEAQSASPLRDALSSLGSRLRGDSSKDKDSSTVDSGDSNDAKIPQTPSHFASRKALQAIIPTSPHPQITPTAQSFSTYILLLSSTNRASQIPVTLAWMRLLGVRPLKRSLAIAVALWSEASMRGPLIERYGARESEFDRLVRWLRDWLGNEGLPSDMAVSWAFRKLKEEREK